MKTTTLRTRETTGDRSGERGAALILALMVSLVLVFLGLGLLLQTSLGLQAAGTERWVTKAMYAADAGSMMQINMIVEGALGGFDTAGATNSFVLTDDPNLPGLLRTQFTVTVSNFCTTEPDQPAVGFETGEKGFSQRFFHLRSQAVRTVGDLVGLTSAAIEADVASQPFNNAEFIPVVQCY